MTRHRARSFQLESLEGKQLLSTLHPAHHATPKPAALVLDGTLSGLRGQTVHTTDSTNSNFQSQEPVSGKIKSLGRVQANVNVSTNFSRDSATPITHNEIVLQGAKGSVTLSYGPDILSEQVKPHAVIGVYHYTVVSGTGAYSGASGTGTVTWTDPNAGWDFPTDKLTYRLYSTRS
jgi:hypothetical protein